MNKLQIFISPEAPYYYWLAHLSAIGGEQSTTMRWPTIFGF